MKRVPLKYLAKRPLTNGLGLPGAYDERSWPRYVRTTDIKDERTLREDVFASQPPAVAAPAMLEPRDILMTAAGATIGKSYLHYGTEPACYAGFLVRFSPREDVDERFISYWMQSADYWAQIEQGAVRSTIDNFSAGKYRVMSVPCPSLDVQRRVADFLDDQCTRLDTIVGLREEQIVASTNLAHVRIQETLLGVPSGALMIGRAPWFVAAPTHACLEPLKAKWQVIDCKHRTPDYEDSGFPVVSPGDISPGRLDLARAHRFVGESDYADLADAPRRPLKGDIVYARNASAGSAAYVDTDEPFTMGQDVCRITSSSQDQLYLAYVLNYLVSPQIESVRVGSTFTRINIEEIKRFVIPVPPVARQRQLAAQCDEVALSSAEMRQVMQEQIGLLRERKRSLITAAVTGGFDVTTAGGRGVVVA